MAIMASLVWAPRAFLGRPTTASNVINWAPNGAALALVLKARRVKFVGAL